jgi:hypothetical protein
MLLEFTGPIAAPRPGDIVIQRLLARGAYSPEDYSSYFSFTVEDNNFLRIRETGRAFVNMHWYSIRNTGDWFGVAPFKIVYRAVYGDVDNSGTTNGLDANDIWAVRGTVVGPCDRYDMDLDGILGGLDAKDAWVYRGSSAPPMPYGHTCSP